MAFKDCSSLENIIISDGVKKIGYGCFDGCKALKNVEIGSSLMELGEGAFINCPNITSIRMRSKEPPLLSEDFQTNYYETFETIVKKEAPLYVPFGTYDAYYWADIWCDFHNIVEWNPPANIDKIVTEVKLQRIYTKGMAIMVEGSNDAENVSVYSIDGRLIYAGKSDCIEVDAAGIYIVRIGNYTTKVIL